MGPTPTSQSVTNCPVAAHLPSLQAPLPAGLPFAPRHYAVIHSRISIHKPGSRPQPPQLPPSPGAPAALQGRRGSQGGVELRPWEVRFSDLVFRKPVGEGSYGRVSMLFLVARWLEPRGSVSNGLQQGAC